MLYVKMWICDKFMKREKFSYTNREKQQKWQDYNKSPSKLDKPN